MEFEHLRLTETEVVKRVRDFLIAKERGNWHEDLAREAGLRGRGADLILIGGNRKSEKFIIECKGKSEAPSAARSSNKEGWIHALGQLVTRMNTPRTIQSGANKGTTNHAYKYGLGLPWIAAKVALRRIPRQIAMTLCIHIFSVSDDGVVKQFTPSQVGQDYPDTAFQ
ncbi:MAG: hypothetical protein FWE16_02300 [Firmicutes bacterium]|nr:hypothetical protein [Bacillota bacterium]